MLNSYQYEVCYVASCGVTCYYDLHNTEHSAIKFLILILNQGLPSIFIELMAFFFV